MSAPNLFWVRTREDGHTPVYIRSDQVEAIKEKSVVTDGGREYAIDDQRKFIKRLLEMNHD